MMAMYLNVGVGILSLESITSLPFEGRDMGHWGKPFWTFLEQGICSNSLDLKWGRIIPFSWWPESTLSKIPTLFALLGWVQSHLLVKRQSSWTSACWCWGGMTCFLHGQFGGNLNRCNLYPSWIILSTHWSEVRRGHRLAKVVSFPPTRRLSRSRTMTEIAAGFGWDAGWAFWAISCLGWEWELLCLRRAGGRRASTSFRVIGSPMPFTMKSPRGWGGQVRSKPGEDPKGVGVLLDHDSSHLPSIPEEFFHSTAYQQASPTSWVAKVWGLESWECLGTNTHCRGSQCQIENMCRHSDNVLSALLSLVH